MCIKNTKANTNFRKKNLQTDVTGIWSMLNNIIKRMFE